MLINTKIYPAGYKPRIVTASLTVEFFNKQHESTIKNNPHRKKDYVKTFSVKEEIITLDEDNLFPTQRMHLQSCLRAYKSSEIKGKFHEWVFTITALKVLMEHGRVNYAFDQNKD